MRCYAIYQLPKKGNDENLIKNTEPVWYAVIEGENDPIKFYKKKFNELTDAEKDTPLVTFKAASRDYIYDKKNKGNYQEYGLTSVLRELIIRGVGSDRYIETEGREKLFAKGLNVEMDINKLSEEFFCITSAFFYKKVMSHFPKDKRERILRGAGNCYYMYTLKVSDDEETLCNTKDIINIDNNKKQAGMLPITRDMKYWYAFNFIPDRLGLIGEKQKKQLQRLLEWVDEKDDTLSFFMISGPRLSGKSKLGLHLAIEIDKKEDVAVIWFDNYSSKILLETELKKQVNQFVVIFDNIMFYPVLFYECLELLRAYSQNKVSIKIIIIDRLAVSELKNMLERRLGCHSQDLRFDSLVTENIEESEWPIIIQQFLNYLIENDISENYHVDQETIQENALKKLYEMKKIYPLSSIPFYIRNIVLSFYYGGNNYNWLFKCDSSINRTIMGEIDKLRGLFAGFLGDNEPINNAYIKECLIVSAIATMCGGLTFEKIHELPKLKSLPRYQSETNPDYRENIEDAIKRSIFFDEEKYVVLATQKAFAIILSSVIFLNEIYFDLEDFKRVLLYVISNYGSLGIDLIDDIAHWIRLLYEDKLGYDIKKVRCDLFCTISDMCHNIYSYKYRKIKNEEGLTIIERMPNKDENGETRNIFEESCDELADYLGKNTSQILEEKITIKSKWIQVLDQEIGNCIDMDLDKKDQICSMMNNELYFMKRPGYKEIAKLYTDNILVYSANSIKELRAWIKTEDTCHRINGRKIVAYCGDILLGLPHGKGILTWNNGVKYEGYFYKGSLTGTGSFTHPATNKNPERTYTCSLIHGFRHGQGKYIWDDNSYYEGEWYMGLRNGYGSMHYNGYPQIVSGKWEMDRFVGQFPEELPSTIDVLYQVPEGKGIYSTCYEERGSIIDNYR